MQSIIIIEKRGDKYAEIVLSVECILWLDYGFVYKAIPESESGYTDERQLIIYHEPRDIENRQSTQELVLKGKRAERAYGWLKEQLNVGCVIPESD